MKTILILGNSSAGLVNFRLQLVKALRRSCRVVISLPDEVRREELDALGCVLVRTSIDRRGTSRISCSHTPSSQIFMAAWHVRWRAFPVSRR